MVDTLTFAKAHVYDARKFGITLPTTLSAGVRIIEFEAKLDTGSSLCVFPRRYGEEIGFDIESGAYERIGTVIGGFVAFGHWATLSVLGYAYETTVYFAKDQDFNRNILGRQGWLDRVRLGLVDYNSRLYLSDYNDT